MADEYATKSDLSRVEHKVDLMATAVFTVSSDLRSVRDQMVAREAMEKQAQVLLAEVNAARAIAANEKSANAESWNTMKTRALWAVMSVLLMVSFPGLVTMVKQLRGLVP